MTTPHEGTSGLTELLSLPTQRAEEFVNWTPEPEEPEPGPMVHRHGVVGLGTAEMSFLRAVIDNPGLPSSRYAKLAGIGTHQAIAVRKRLVEQGLLLEHRVSTGARGRASNVLEPSPEAVEILAEGSK